MGGVGDELALRVNGGVERPHRLLERVEHRVEAAGEAPDLIVCDGRYAPAEVPRAGDVLCRLGEASQRPDGGPCDEQAEQGGEGDAAGVETARGSAQFAQSVSTSVSGWASCTARGVDDVLGEDAQVDAATRASEK